MKLCDIDHVPKFFSNADHNKFTNDHGIVNGGMEPFPITTLDISLQICKIGLRLSDQVSFPLTYPRLLA